MAGRPDEEKGGLVSPKRFSAFLALALYLAAFAPVARAAGPSAGQVADVTATPTGRSLAAQALTRWQGHKWDTSAIQPRHVLKVGDGDYLIASFLPTNLKMDTGQTTSAGVSPTVTFDVSAEAAPSTAGPMAPATSAQWVWIGQNCFSRMSNGYGWLDSCYVMHKLNYESDPRDFYQLEQYGTVGAANTYPIGKIYDGWLAAQKASSSSAMSWIDWSPRGSVSGSCVVEPLSVTALGVSITGSGIMCERWNIYKYSDGGHFENQWSCGCVYPFGQPYPNTREIDYMQAISVPGGGSAVWTLSAGFTAVP